MTSYLPRLTRGTYGLMRLEYLLLEGIAVLLAAIHYDQINLWLFVGLFAYIDLFGYLPGAVAHRRGDGGPIYPGYYYAYNTFHSIPFNLLVLLVITWVHGPDWAMLAVPIHLFGDRSLFGNIFKSPSQPFEPVARPLGDDRVSPQTLARHCHHTSGYLAMNQETKHFIEPDIDGFVPFREQGSHLFVFGGVFAEEPHKTLLFERFRAWAAARGLGIIILQMLREEAPFFRERGFRVNQFGCSYSLRLADFHTRGGRFMKLRNKLKRAKGAGLEVVELGRDAPYDAGAAAALDRLTQSWLATKGKHTKLLEFMVGELTHDPADPTRVFVARRGEEILAFVSYVPVYGPQAGWLHDLSRRMPDAPPGAMELINVTAMERMRDEGVAYLHFGFTPFVGVNRATDDVPGRNPLMSWAIEKLVQYGEFIYPARTQAAYKQKWSPDIQAPEYVAFDGSFPLFGVINLLRVTRAI